MQHRQKSLYIFSVFMSNSEMEFCAQLSWAWKKFYNLEA